MITFHKKKTINLIFATFSIIAAILMTIIGVYEGNFIIAIIAAIFIVITTNQFIVFKRKTNETIQISNEGIIASEYGINIKWHQIIRAEFYTSYRANAGVDIKFYNRVHKIEEVRISISQYFLLPAFQGKKLKKLFDSYSGKEIFFK
jgi:hypothetical protein